MGSTELFLRLVSLSSAYLAHDLRDSFFGTYYACQVSELTDLHLSISRYLQGKGLSPYNNPPSMVQRVYRMAKRVLEQGRGRCWERIQPWPPQYNGHGNGHGHDHIYRPPNNRRPGQGGTAAPLSHDILKRSFRLRYGEEMTVPLTSPRYIRKLIISAEGVRNDAIFDVLVNGDIKGTIYVPGRDPSYYVTIEEFAESVEFVSRRGTAKITNIRLIP